MLAEIRQLDPKPGRAFGGGSIQPLVPDVIVRAAAGGAWHVELNTEVLPRILVNNSYAARVTQAQRQRRRQDLHVDLPADRQLADQKP